jgi:hypothetical protein
MKREGKGLCGSASELVLREAEGTRTVALARLPLTWGRRRHSAYTRQHREQSSPARQDPVPHKHLHISIFTRSSYNEFEC